MISTNAVVLDFFVKTAQSITTPVHRFYETSRENIIDWKANLQTLNRTFSSSSSSTTGVTAAELQDEGELNDDTPRLEIVDVDEEQGEEDSAVRLDQDKKEDEQSSSSSFRLASFLASSTISRVREQHSALTKHLSLAATMLGVNGDKEPASGKASVYKGDERTQLQHPYNSTPNMNNGGVLSKQLSFPPDRSHRSMSVSRIETPCIIIQQHESFQADDGEEQTYTGDRRQSECRVEAFGELEISFLRNSFSLLKANRDDVAICCHQCAITVPGAHEKYQHLSKYKSGCSWSATTLGMLILSGIERILLRIDNLKKFQAAVHLLRDTHKHIDVSPKMMVLSIKALEQQFIEHVVKACAKANPQLENYDEDLMQKSWRRFFRLTRLFLETF